MSLTWIGKAMLLSMGVYSETKYRFLEREKTCVSCQGFQYTEVS